MAQPELVDFSYGPPQAACLKRNGVKGVIMYTSIGPSPKNVTKAKADAYLAQGLDIVTVFEEAAGHMLGGASAGKAAAKASVEMARAAGAPQGIGHYFALDVDPRQLVPAQRRHFARVSMTPAPVEELAVMEPAPWDAVVRVPRGRAVPVMLTAGQWDQVFAYLNAAKAVLADAGDYAGLYGGYLAVQKTADLVKYLWQTYAWSAGLLSPWAHLYQYLNGQSYCGGTVDFDEIRKPFYGGWRAGEESSMAFVVETEAQFKQLIKDTIHEAAADNSHEFGITGDRVKSIKDRVDGLVVPTAADIKAAMLAAVPELATAIAAALPPNPGGLTPGDVETAVRKVLLEGAAPQA